MGRHLIAELCRQQYEIRVLTRTPLNHLWLARYKGVEVIEGDLNDRNLLMSAVQGCKFVIHAGGKFRFWGDEDLFREINEKGTRNIVDAAIHADVERFIHISSIAVVGKPDPYQIINETFRPQPVDAYQRSKFQAEQLVLNAYREKNLSVIILRPGAFYGPLGTYGFNRLFFQDPMRGIIMQIDMGRHIIFPAYIADVVQGISLALIKGHIGEIYNVCGSWISHKEVFDIVCEEANLHWPRPPVPGWLGLSFSYFLEYISHITGREPFWPINLHSYVYGDWRVSNEKARRDLDFLPTEFRVGARRTIEWYNAKCPENILDVEC